MSWVEGLVIIFALWVSGLFFAGLAYYEACQVYCDRTYTARWLLAVLLTGPLAMASYAGWYGTRAGYRALRSLILDAALIPIPPPDQLEAAIEAEIRDTERLLLEISKMEMDQT